MFKLILNSFEYAFEKRPSAVTSQPPTDKTSINQKHIIFAGASVSL